MNGLDDPNFGLPKTADPYKQTRETVYQKREQISENRFRKQFNRELKRSKVSNSAITEKINRDINDFVSKTTSEKNATISAGNTSQSRLQQQSMPQITNSSEMNSSDGGIQAYNSSNSDVPKAYGAWPLDVCYNGAPCRLLVATYGDPVPIA